ncbi:hypothetical protein C8R46DRAFT_1024561 [Mycena filopes]|nr:hypothetical protein C8R46DRAFT_1024561 [Mycena filopes]
MLCPPRWRLEDAGALASDRRGSRDSKFPRVSKRAASGRWGNGATGLTAGTAGAQCVGLATGASDKRASKGNLIWRGARGGGRENGAEGGGTRSAVGLATGRGGRAVRKDGAKGGAVCGVADLATGRGGETTAVWAPRTGTGERRAAIAGVGHSVASDRGTVVDAGPDIGPELLATEGSVSIGLASGARVSAGGGILGGGEADWGGDRGGIGDVGESWWTRLGSP